MDTCEKKNFLEIIKAEYELLGVLGDKYVNKGRSTRMKLLRLEEVRDVLRELIPLYDKHVIAEDYNKRLSTKDDNTNWPLMEEVGETGWTQD